MRIRGGRIRRAGALALMLALVLLGGRAPPVAAQATSNVPAHAVQAAYLYRFAGYVEWPASRFDESDSPFVIGVMGMSALGDELVEIARGRSIDGRTVDVRLLSPEDPLTDLHILFIGADAFRAGRVGEAARSQSILVITDSDDASGEAATIRFRIVDNRVRFEIFLDEAERNGLKLSSRLLAVALRVHGARAE